MMSSEPFEAVFHQIFDEMFGNIENPQCLYVMLNGEQVKIGRSRDPRRRLREAQTFAPGTSLIMSFFMYGKASFWEARLHRMFAGQRTAGEWYKATSEMKYFLADLGRSLDAGDGHFVDNEKALMDCMSSLRERRQIGVAYQARAE